MLLKFIKKCMKYAYTQFKTISYKINTCHLQYFDHVYNILKIILYNFYFLEIGECLILLGNIPKAREYVNKAVQCGKQETSYALLIKILLMENDIRSAVAVCNAALE